MVVFKSRLEVDHDSSTGSSYSVRKMNDHNVKLFMKSLNCVNWLLMYSLSSVEHKVQFFLNTLIELVDNCFPFKKICCKPARSAKQKWYTNELKLLKEKCLFFYEICKRSSDIRLKAVYSKLKGLYRAEVLSAKKNFNTAILESADNKPKAIWSLIKNMANVNQRPVVRLMHKQYVY